MLPLRSSEVRDVLDMSASDNLIIVSLPMQFPSLGEIMNEATKVLLLRSRNVREEFDLSTSAILIPPSSPIVWSTMSENEMKPHMLLLRSRNVRGKFDLSASASFMTPSTPPVYYWMRRNEDRADYQKLVVVDLVHRPLGSKFNLDY
jgi:hypothetical protein